jgi:beta-lactamase superfamily II metal-dependent hydrolase
MKVQVLSIQSANATNTHEVLLSVGTDRQKFIFTTEVNRVGEHLLQTTRGDRTFYIEK